MFFHFVFRSVCTTLLREDRLRLSYNKNVVDVVKTVEQRQDKVSEANTENRNLLRKQSTATALRERYLNE